MSKMSSSFSKFSRHGGDGNWSSSFAFSEQPEHFSRSHAGHCQEPLNCKSLRLGLIRLSRGELPYTCGPRSSPDHELKSAYSVVWHARCFCQA